MARCRGPLASAGRGDGFCGECVSVRSFELEDRLEIYSRPSARARKREQAERSTAVRMRARRATRGLGVTVTAADGRVRPRRRRSVTAARVGRVAADGAVGVAGAACRRATDTDEKLGASWQAARRQ